MDASADVARGLMLLDLSSREDFKHALRCLLVHRREDLRLFEDAFERFWLVQTDASFASRERRKVNAETDPNGFHDVSSAESDVTQTVARIGVSTHPAHGERTEGADRGGESLLGIYSREEYLCSKDFGLMSPEELRATTRILHALDWTFTERRSRRSSRGEDGAQLDVRGSLRASMSHGGELFRLKHRGPRTKRRPLILLCDVSGSMDRYTRLLLHFLHSVEHSRDRTEVFVFATRLTRITASLRHLDPDAAVAAVAGEVRDWSGGTRIGESVRCFNRHWSRRVMAHGALVLLISDGWDRGNPELLAAEMRRLQRTSYRMMWLNPLLGSTEYRPLTLGLQAALPFVDDFLPAHNVSSLSHLIEHLSRVQAKRPPRSREMIRP